jgi:hypothetical protein
MKIDYNKHIWEGWLVKDFIDELSLLVQMIMNGTSYLPKFENREQLKKWCMDNQPYYKKYILEVVEHFAKHYNLK